MQLNEVTEVERLLAARNYSAAATLLDVALAARADDTLALLLQSELELALERNDRARQFLERALGSQLESPKAAIKLLGVLSDLSESDLMIRVCAQIPPQHWDSATSLAQVAHLLTGVGAYETAIPFAEAAITRDTKHPPGLYALATLRTFFGQLDEAAELCRRVIELIPEDPGSWWLLSRLRQRDPGSRIDRLRTLIGSTTSADDHIWLHYALHNELHDCGDFEPSWEALAEACRIKRAEMIESRRHQLQLFAALRAQHDWTDLRSHSDSQNALSPVFVIGLHRSGTTLAEQILAGHSAIASGGETYDIRAQLRRNSKLHFGSELDQRVIDRRNELDYEAIGRNYRQGITWRAQGRRMVTDKLPSNYFNVGFIARALPNSKFICLSRDPIDVGFSSLRTLFSHAAPYSYDAEDFVEHHREYESLMQHWRQCLPGRILDIRYEDLVNAPEQTTRIMTQFLGIDFEPEMLALQTRKNAVATASSVMLRDGIRKDRGQVWQPYAHHLSPLLQAFS